MAMISNTVEAKEFEVERIDEHIHPIKVFFGNGDGLLSLTVAEAHKLAHDLLDHIKTGEMEPRAVKAA